MSRVRTCLRFVRVQGKYVSKVSNTSDESRFAVLSIGVIGSTCVKRSTGHTHAHTQTPTENNTADADTHTNDKNNTPNPQMYTSHKHLTTLEGGATIGRGRVRVSAWLGFVCV